MPETNTSSDAFMSRVAMAIEAHIADESFGVADLAEEMNMSRSTLLRRVKSSSGVSVAVFIRQVRLQQAKRMLQDESLTISEVAYQAGFSSSSYFAKCFREEYGYPPSEESNQQVVDSSVSPSPHASTQTLVLGLSRRTLILLGVGILALVIGLVLLRTSANQPTVSPKTIAVLPFQNDSEDSSNVYVINGLMAAIIDNLHQIDELQVTSRTTVERYRGDSRTLPELAEALDVHYFVEGSGQKIGNQIQLTLRLVDGLADTLIWVHRYKRETTDIFQLQAEVSTSIAQEIEIFITPEEQARIELPPTQNLVAYDYYLKGLEQIKTESREGLIAGVTSFQQAIEEDAQFAHPHAYLAISYYFLDLFQVDKDHLDDINTYADKALLLNPDLTESLIGKALYYMQAGQYELAIQYFQKVLIKSPGLGWVHNLMSTIYTWHIPNTEQYLLHALQGIRYAVAGQDSHTVSMSYLHLANALAQNGFLPEAEPYVEKSLLYNPDNLFAETLSIYTQLGQDHELELAFQRLQKLLAKDTTFLSTVQEVAKIAYYQGKYEVAWDYYQQFLLLKEAAGMNVYPEADINIAHVLSQLGRPAEAASYQESYLAYFQQEESIYTKLGYAVYYASTQNYPKAMTTFQEFARQEAEGYQYWFVMFVEQEPILTPLKTDPAYAKSIKLIQDRFWTQHERMRKVLDAEGVLQEHEGIQ